MNTIEAGKLAPIIHLGSGAITTLFGAFFGYVFSGISDEEKDNETNSFNEANSTDAHTSYG